MVIPKTPSTLTKVRQIYWEARQSFNESLGRQEDVHVICSDAELDIRIELLHAADSHFSALLRVLARYRRTLGDLASAQYDLGAALVEFGGRDFTSAGIVMRTGGRIVSRIAQRQLQLDASLEKLYEEVEIFQRKATADVRQTVFKMEKARRSYRSGLVWLQNESWDVDPEVNKKLGKYRRVQEQIRRLKTRFDGVKLECMQKIDLFLLSRSNLFSQAVPPYTRAFRKIARHSAAQCAEMSSRNTPLSASFKFVAVRELNEYSELVRKRLASPGGQRKGEGAGKPDNSQPHGKIPLPQSLGPEPLIDLNNEGRSIAISPLTAKPQVKCYSSDLLSVTLGDHTSCNGNGFLLLNFEDSDSKSDSAYRGQENDLRFWSLIRQSVESGAPEPLQGEDQKASITSKYAPQSKWNDILTQFDPFLVDGSKQEEKIETGTLELC